MTLMELQDILGENIKAVNDLKTDGDVPPEQI